MLSTSVNTGPMVATVLSLVSNSNGFLRIPKNSRDFKEIPFDSSITELFRWSPNVRPRLRSTSWRSWHCLQSLQRLCQMRQDDPRWWMYRRIRQVQVRLQERWCYLQRRRRKLQTFTLWMWCHVRPSACSSHWCLRPAIPHVLVDYGRLRNVGSTIRSSYFLPTKRRWSIRSRMLWWWNYSIHFVQFCFEQAVLSRWFS